MGDPDVTETPDVAAALWDGLENAIEAARQDRRASREQAAPCAHSTPCAREGCLSRAKDPVSAGWRIAWPDLRVYCSMTCLRLDELEIAASEPHDGHWLHFGITDEGEVTWRIVCLCADSAGGCPIVNSLAQCSCTIWEHYDGEASSLDNGRRIQLQADDGCWSWRYA